MSVVGLVGVYGECKDVARNVHAYVVVVEYGYCKGAAVDKETVECEHFISFYN